MKVQLHKVIPLKALMKQQGVTDRQLAKQLGMSYSHINRLKNQRSVATPATAKKLLGALGVSNEVIDKEV